MKRIILLFALFPIFSFSQNFQTLQPNVKINFEPDSVIYIPLDFIYLNSLSDQITLQKQAPINSIDISSLQVGLYFVEVVTERGNVRKKLIVE